MSRQLITLAVFAATATFADQALAQSTEPAKKPELSLSNFLSDSAAGQVSAANLLGIAGDAVTAVENTRTLVAAIKGLGTEGSQVALSFAPARSAFLPMSLSTYANSNAMRLLGNMSVAYAQGTAKVGDTDMMRRAISLETEMTFSRDDDPLIAGPGGCTWEAPIATPDNATPDFSEANKRYTDCVAEKTAALAKRWNISRFSLSAGTGDVKPTGGNRTGLGTTVAASLVYGFDHVDMAALRDGAALAITLRHTNNEPILDQLAQGTVVRRNSNLAAVRLSGGSATVRALAEVSNAKSSEATASQQVYKRALGMDLRLADGLWLNIRSGKQRKASGDGDETVTLINYSFSPKANLF